MFRILLIFLVGIANITISNFRKFNIKGVIAVEIPNEKNSIAKEEIKKNCKKIKIKCKTEKDIYDAVTNYINNKKNDQIIITGSLYLVGKTRKKIIKLLNQSIH